MVVRDQYYRRLLAVDPSLRILGWALFSFERAELVAVGTLSPPGTEIPLSRRYSYLQAEVESLLARLVFGKRDVLVCEGPAPLVVNPQSALKVEGVRGIFETVSRTRGAVVPGRINPRTVQSELLGMRGKQLARKHVKAWARSIALRMYGDNLQRVWLQSIDQGLKDSASCSTRKIPQDIIDAVLIGSLAVARITFAQNCGVAIDDALGKSFRRSNSRSRGGDQGRRGIRWNERDLRKLSSPTKE